MNHYQRSHYTDQLAKEIGYVGKSFEQFAGLFMNLVMDVPVHATGVNILGFPISGVIDGVSADGTIAAEYSAQKGYFEKSMAKASGDVAHVLNKAPRAQQIYLLSAERKRPQVAQKFQDSIAALPSMENRTVTILGAEEIAAHILDAGLANEEAVRRLAEFLPSLQRLADEEAAQGLVPRPDPRRISRPYIDAQLDVHFAQSRCVVIGGLAGSGKSDAAAALAERKKHNYQNVLWVEGASITRIEDLRATSLTRAGEPRNVATLLANRACLLIIDDAQESLSARDCAAICGPNSHVLMTRREIDKDTYVLPMFEKSDALLLLNRDVEGCPDGVFDTIWSTVKGHPLSLSLMNAAVAEGASWEEIEEDCQAVGRFEATGALLADRILARLRQSLEYELSIFEWAAQPRCDQGFFSKAATPLGIRKLRKYGLLAADRPSIIRLHDVVFASLNAKDWWTETNRQAVTAKLDEYLSETSLGTDLKFWSAAGNLIAVIQRLVKNGNRRPAFLYALLSIWTPPEVDAGLVGEPTDDAAGLRQSNASPPPIATMALIEAVEKLYLKDKISDRSQAKVQLEKRLSIFDDLANAPGLTSKQHAEIKHHKAKALSRLDRTPEAIVLFEEVQSGAFPLLESDIQLMRLLRKGNHSDKEKAREIAERILLLAEQGDGVSHSVFFAVVEVLPWISHGSLILKHERLIEQKIVEATNLEIPQAWQTFSSIARYLSQEYPKLLNRLLTEVPQKSLGETDSEKERFDWGDILLEASRTAGSAAAKLQAEALLFFESLAKPERFQQQRHAELLLLMGQAEAAKAMLQRRDDLDTAEFVQRLMAWAEFQLGAFNEALKWMDRALANLKNERFKSEFHEQRFAIRCQLKAPDAIDDIRQAISYCQSERKRPRLEEKLAKYEASA